MINASKVYKKHNSFVEIRQKKPLADGRARLARLLGDRSSMGLPEGRADIVRQACAEAAAWPAPLRVAVNLSATNPICVTASGDGAFYLGG